MEEGQNQEDIKQAIREECCERNQTSGKEYLVECSLGMLEFICSPYADVPELLEKADSVMYQEKKLSILDWTASVASAFSFSFSVSFSSALA